MERADKPIDLSLSIERRATPRRGKVAPLGEHASGSAQSVDRTVAFACAVERGRARPAERAAEPLRRILQRLLQPLAKRAGVEAASLGLGQDSEQRIDTRFHRPLAQKLGAEAVNGIDLRFLQMFERVFERLPNVGICAVRTSAFELFANSKLQLSRRFLRERDRNDL